MTETQFIEKKRLDVVTGKSANWKELAIKQVLTDGLNILSTKRSEIKVDLLREKC